jgi:putative glutamine amidotransferase
MPSLSDPMPLVAVTADVKPVDGYLWHAAPASYLEAAFRAAKVMPLVVPSFGADTPIDALLDTVHGVMVTGSRSNVHPTLYGTEPSTAHEPYDPARDATSLPMIRRALERGIPLFAICRGIQELNVALGGTLATEIQEQPGKMDHRAPVVDDTDVKFGIRQSVRIAERGCLGAILGGDSIDINSLHRQAIDRLGEGLTVEAVAEDGTIEAVSVSGAKAFAVGVQWHPEYWALSDKPSADLFHAFGEAVRAHHNGHATRDQGRLSTHLGVPSAEAAT